MRKQLLYFNFEDKIFEYHLPALNNRRYSIVLSGMYTTWSYLYTPNNQEWKNYISSIGCCAG